MLKERKGEGCGGRAGGWGEGAVHLDRKHRGEEQELEVSLTERKGGVVVVVRGGLGAAEVPSPLLTELRVESGGGVRQEGGDRDRDQGKIKGVCRGRKMGGRSGWVRGAVG